MYLTAKRVWNADKALASTSDVDVYMMARDITQKQTIWLAT